MKLSPLAAIALSETVWLAIAGGFVLLLLVFIVLGYKMHLSWTGLPEHWQPKDDGIEVVPRKTLWDWLQLLVVPLALAVGVFVLNEYQTSRERERATEDQQQQLLTDYLSSMSELFLRGLGEQDPSERVTDAARSITFGVLPRLDEERKARVFNFLRSADLLTAPADPNEFWLRGADFSGADMKGADLSGDSLVRLNFSGADFTHANLDNAILRDVNLSRANVTGAIFGNAKLNGVDFRSAVVQDADFTSARLKECDFTNARGVDGVDFGHAMLHQTSLPN